MKLHVAILPASHVSAVWNSPVAEGADFPLIPSLHLPRPSVHHQGKLTVLQIWIRSFDANTPFFLDFPHDKYLMPIFGMDISLVYQQHYAGDVTYTTAAKIGEGGFAEKVRFFVKFFSVQWYRPPKRVHIFSFLPYPPGLGFVCFVVTNPRVLSKSWLWAFFFCFINFQFYLGLFCFINFQFYLGLFCFIIFQFYPPPPPIEQGRSLEGHGGGHADVERQPDSHALCRGRCCRPQDDYCWWGRQWLFLPFLRGGGVECIYCFFS